MDGKNIQIGLGLPRPQANVTIRFMLASAAENTS